MSKSVKNVEPVKNVPNNLKNIFSVDAIKDKIDGTFMMRDSIRSFFHFIQF